MVLPLMHPHSYSHLSKYKVGYALDLFKIRLHPQKERMFTSCNTAREFIQRHGG